MTTTIAHIQQSMELNRHAFERRVVEIRNNPQLSASERRRLLAETWFDAMRVHYRLLGAYLQLRDSTSAWEAPATPRLKPAHLRAPLRPGELPESLSRYVTAAHYSEHLI